MSTEIKKIEKFILSQDSLVQRTAYRESCKNINKVRRERIMRCIEETGKKYYRVHGYVNSEICELVKETKCYTTVQKLYKNQNGTTTDYRVHKNTMRDFEGNWIREIN